LVIASHISNTPSTAVVPTHFHRARWLFVFLPALISLVVPATAWGDIYKWTDEHGRINISNVPPPTSGKAKNIEIVLKEPKPTSIPDHAATSSEQALLARIDNLERQLRTQQYAPQAPAVPPPTPYPSYYPSTPSPPPQPNYYDSGYDAGYNSGFYPSNYPSYYPTYYYPVASSYVVYPARTFVTRPAFAAARGGSFRSGGGHGGGHGGRR